MQKKFYYIQRNVFIFRVALKKFSIFREIAYLKKLFYIQRKYCIYSLYLVREMFFFYPKNVDIKKNRYIQRKPRIQISNYLS